MRPLNKFKTTNMKKSKKQLHFAHPLYWPVWSAFGLLWLITRLPYRVQLKIGAGIGMLAYYLPTKLKPITAVNIKLCFPELTPKQQTQLIKKNFASLGIGIMEAAMAWWLPDNKLQCKARITGYEHVAEAYAKGKGIILLGPHFTCLEMIARLLGMHYSFTILYRPHKKRLLAYIQERFRVKNNVRYIPRHKVRDLFRSLESNQAIWYAYDVDGGDRRGVFAPFFDISTSSLTSVSRIAEKSNAAVIPISFYRLDDEASYEIKLSAALENFPSGDLVADATRLNAVIEKAIREKPEQYVWQYKRFKTRPPGEKRFY